MIPKTWMHITREEFENIEIGDEIQLSDMFLATYGSFQKEKDTKFIITQKKGNIVSFYFANFMWDIGQFTDIKNVVKKITFIRTIEKELGL